MKCAHCNGSGFCQYSKIRYEVNYNNKSRSIVWRECKKCGDSETRGYYSWVFNEIPTPADARYAKAYKPFCSACSGRGY